MKISNCVSQNYFNLKTEVTHIIPTARRKLLYVAALEPQSMEVDHMKLSVMLTNDAIIPRQHSIPSQMLLLSTNWTKNDIKNPAGICEGRGERRHAMYDCRPTWSCLVRCDITHLKGDVCYRILVRVQECYLVKCRLLHESCVPGRDLWGKYGGNKQNYQW